MKKHTTLLAFLILCISVLSACATLTYKYEHFELSFSEPDSEIVYSLSGKEFTIGENKLYISDQYSDKEKQAIVSFAEVAFSKLAPDIPLIYIIGKGFSSRAENERGRIYLGTNDTTVFLHTTLQSLGSGALNYGLLWGVSERLCAEINGKALETEDKKVVSLLTEKPYLLDMEAPLFFSNFSDKETVKNAKTVAVSFVNWLYDEGIDIESLFENNLLAVGEEISGTAFKDFNNLFTDLKNRYLKALGILQTIAPAQYSIRYIPFTVATPLLIETDWGVWHIKKDYDNPYKVGFSSGISELSIEWSDFSYPSQKKLFEQMSVTVDNILGAFDYTFENLQPKYQYFVDEDVYYVDKVGGYTDYINHRIYLSNLIEFAHEFTHAVEHVSGYFLNGDYYVYRWLSEGVAEYTAYTYSLEYRKFGYAGIQEDIIYSVEHGFDFEHIYQQAQQTVNDDIHAWKDAEAYWSVKEGYHLKNDDNTTYYFRHSSFVYYLVDKFGWDNAVKVFKQPSLFTNVFGQSQYNLWREWGEDLFARFEDVAPKDLLSVVGR
ncbi:MAG: hypothetical protein K2O04_02820 [Clostridiales bacterium]|nr:hypothetical protein [Clostridiales bacterium]